MFNIIDQYETPLIDDRGCAGQEQLGPNCPFSYHVKHDVHGQS